MTRCAWCGDDPLYVSYHDEEWGKEERDSRSLWENLTLESFQAGLSWITILRKRNNFRAAFEGFDPAIVAQFGEDNVQELLQNEGIIRHRGKIEATIRSAQIYLEIETTDGFSEFIWSFVDGKSIINSPKTMKDIPTFTPQAEALSKALKKRGFKFVGPSITYAFMQASGLVNDHMIGCDAK